MHGPDELYRTAAPAHAFSNRQFGDGLIDDAAQQARRGHAVLGAAEYQPRALVGFELLERIDRHTAILRERDSCLSRQALRIEGALERRPAPLDLLVRLMLR